ncbi:MAG: hypothetical protein M1837_003572 [Sclerophora amabilis]|nr:MAG: hypothetical protein M1837_003572 [Sclerophora amabilis]
MAPSSNDEQFKFLISCIRNANNSKVDFAEVAKECGIVSKGAAAKRYERMMKAHGINNPGGIATRSAPAPAGSRRDNSGSAKKRKLDHFEDTGTHAIDDDEGVQQIKNEVEAAGPEEPLIKSEEQAGYTVDDEDAPTGSDISNAADMTTSQGDEGALRGDSHLDLPNSMIVRPQSPMNQAICGGSMEGDSRLGYPGATGARDDSIVIVD